jgi:CRISPR-associated protein Cas2
MTVFILERVPPGLKGLLGRWMVEVSKGVFAGRLSRLVRERLWERIAEKATETGASGLMVFRANNPQGFDVRVVNPRGRYAELVDGIWLVRRPAIPPRRASGDSSGSPSAT